MIFKEFTDRQFLLGTMQNLSIPNRQPLIVVVKSCLALRKKYLKSYESLFELVWDIKRL